MLEKLALYFVSLNVSAVIQNNEKGHKYTPSYGKRGT
jgi:hypothetical protein